MQSTRQKWTANSMIGPLTPVVSLPRTPSRSPMRPSSQLARAVVSPRVSRPVLSTLSRQSSKRSERHTAKRTISGYPVSQTRFHYYIVIVLVLIQTHSPPQLLVDSAKKFIFLLVAGTCTRSNDEQPPFATSFITMVCVACTAVSGRPSSAIFQRGPSTSPCMTGSKPASANCHWASIPRWQSQSGSIPHRPPRVISRSYVNIRGPSTFSRPWSPARPALSVPIRSGSLKRALWCVCFLSFHSPPLPVSVP
jgi:hypothetical protein